MREDMSKVIVERPRHKPWRARKGRPQHIEDLPRFQGLNRFHAERGSTKHLNENLAPLRRYLFKQVGRPWVKVYGEISAHLRADNPVQQHVRDHLRDYVNLTPRRDVPSQAYRFARHGWPWREPLYVDPLSGLLCRTDHLPDVRKQKRQEASRPEPKPEVIPLSEHKELRRLDDLWYEIELATLPVAEYRRTKRTVRRTLGWGPKARQVDVEEWARTLITPPVRDAVTGQAVFADATVHTRSSNGWKTIRQTHYATSKRSLSHKELKAYGLLNG